MYATTPPAPIQVPFHAEFISRAVESVRLSQSLDSVIRIRAETNQRAFVTFNAHWLQQRSKDRDITRRVHLEAKADAQGDYLAYFMAKPFDENAVTKRYNEANLSDLAKDVQSYLCMSRAPA